MIHKTGPTRSPFMTMTCPAIVLLVFAAGLRAQDKPNLTPAKAPKAPVQHTETLSPLQTLEIRQIAALRALTGGGVAERLQGAIPGTDPEQLFLDSLKNFVTQKKTTTQTFPLPAAAQCPPANHGRKNPTTSSPAQAALRSTAKKLEDLAAELEQVQIYDKADELRELATKYWLQARSLK